jgi:type IV secretion system protein VirD4
MSPGPGGGAVRRPVSSSPGELVFIAVLGAAAAVIAGTWVTGQLAGLLFRHAWPPAGIGQAPQITFAVLGHLHDPALAWPARARPALPGPAGFAVAAAAVTAVAGAAAWLAARTWLGSRSPAGFASGRQLGAALTERAVIARAAITRPSLAGIPARRIPLTQAGVRLGRAVPGGTRLAISGEESVVVLAGTRAGKTSQVIIPWLADWPGPALVTSVRPDVLTATAALRTAGGPALVLDPAAMTRWPDRLAWSPVAGCADYGKARQRADIMITVGRGQQADSTGSGFFAANAVSLLAGWLHAAALAGTTMNDVLSWAFAGHYDTPVRLLAGHRDAAPGIADMLAALYRLTDATRTSLWATVQAALAPLLSPAARAVFTPPPGGSADLGALITSRATVYLIVEKDKATGLAPVITAFCAELTETAKQLADRSPGGRLDPPLGLFLDEAANITPLPQLPDLMSYAGGTGIFTTVVLHSIAQARTRWGPDGAAMLTGAASVKLALGGLSGDELRALSGLAGEVDQAQLSWQHGPGGTTMHHAARTQPVISPAQIRTLDAGRREALVIHASTPAVKITMTRYYEGPRKNDFEHAAARARQVLTAPGPAIPTEPPLPGDEP